MKQIYSIVRAHIEEHGEIPERVNVSKKVFAEAFLKQELDHNLPYRFGEPTYYTYMGIRVIPSDGAVEE